MKTTTMVTRTTTALNDNLIKSCLNNYQLSSTQFKEFPHLIYGQIIIMQVAHQLNYHLNLFELWHCDSVSWLSLLPPSTELTRLRNAIFELIETHLDCDTHRNRRSWFIILRLWLFARWARVPLERPLDRKESLAVNFGSAKRQWILSESVQDASLQSISAIRHWLLVQAPTIRSLFLSNAHTHTRTHRVSVPAPNRRRRRCHRLCCFKSFKQTMIL